MSVAEGHGPVNALDLALRKDLGKYQAEIADAARTHGVEEAVIRAIMHAESAYNPRALSRVGAQGLMQLMPATARRFGVSNAFDARQNIQGGVQYLAWLLKRFGGDLTLAAAGYNAGEGAVDRHGGVPPYAETRAYVPKVMELFTKRLVQADPKAKGGMDALKKGRGGFKVEERCPKVTELEKADEAFVTGSLKEILGVVRIGGHRIGKGTPGPVTQHLHRLFRTSLQHWLD